jgi:hypothetical protein
MLYTSIKDDTTSVESIRLGLIIAPPPGPVGPVSPGGPPKGPVGPCKDVLNIHSVFNVNASLDLERTVPRICQSKSKVEYTSLTRILQYSKGDDVTEHIYTIVGEPV